MVLNLSVFSLFDSTNKLFTQSCLRRCYSNMFDGIFNVFKCLYLTSNNKQMFLNTEVPYSRYNLVSLIKRWKALQRIWNSYVICVMIFLWTSYLLHFIFSVQLCWCWRHNIPFSFNFFFLYTSKSLYNNNFLFAICT